MLMGLVCFVLGACAGVVMMAILSGRLDDRMEQKKKKGR